MIILPGCPLRNPIHPRLFISVYVGILKINPNKQPRIPANRFPVSAEGDQGKMHPRWKSIPVNG